MRTHEYADFLPPSYEKTVLYQIVNMMPTFPGDTGGVPSPWLTAFWWKMMHHRNLTGDRDGAGL